MNSQFNRRDFLKTSAAGLSFAFTLAADPCVLIGEAAAADAPLSATAWVTIAPDGAITIVSPAAEMGQGSFTTLPAIIAEELDADWSKVTPILPPEWDEKKYGNHGYTGGFQTSASASEDGDFKALRIAGAQPRRVLLDAAAATCTVPVGDM